MIEINARPLDDRDPTESPAIFSEGRICRESNCDTVLSIYNSGSKCSKHGGWPARRHIVYGLNSDDLGELMAEEPAPA
jgi:hypothetical protein